MRNAEYDTPTSGDLNDGDAEGRRILEGLREHLRETGSLAGSLSRRAQALGGAPLRRLIAEACRELRGQHDIEGDFIRLGEKWSSGYDAITVRDLRAAPPASAGKWKRIGILTLRAVAGAGAGLFAMSEFPPPTPIPHWLGIVGGLVGFAAAGAAPGFLWKEKP